jgi:hypothetical protein
VPISDTGTASSGNQRGAPVLQEHEHHEEHQDHRLAQRLHHLGDRHLDEARGVVGNGVGHALAGKRADSRSWRALTLGDVERVGARLQEDAHQHRLLAVVGAVEIVVLGAQLDPRDVAQAQLRAVGVRTQDDVLEFVDGRTDGPWW